MNELLRRLRSRPVITGELLFGSFLVNIMAMASPLFAMQVLNRYVGLGVDATFYTLTSGVLIAIIFEFVPAHRLPRASVSTLTKKPHSKVSRHWLSSMNQLRAWMQKDTLRSIKLWQAWPNKVGPLL